MKIGIHVASMHNGTVKIIDPETNATLSLLRLPSLGIAHTTLEPGKLYNIIAESHDRDTVPDGGAESSD